MEEQIKEKTEEKQEEVIEGNFFQRAKRRIQEEFISIGKFLKEHPEHMVTTVTGAIGIVVTATGFAIKCFSGNSENCYVPDEVTGMNYLTDHPLTNSEIMELSDRMIDGESTGEALTNMGVLKNEKKRR